MKIVEAVARRRLRIVALIDLCKGTAVLAVAFGLFNAGRHALENGGVSFLRLLNVDSTGDASLRFLAFLHTVDAEHSLFTTLVIVYARLRFVEAYGLWLARSWARWLGLVSAGIYVPFETYYFLKDFDPATFVILAINLIVLWLLWPHRKKSIETALREMYEHQIR